MQAEPSANVTATTATVGNVAEPSTQQIASLSEDTKVTGAGRSWDYILLVDARWPTQLPLDWGQKLGGQVVGDASVDAEVVAQLAAWIPAGKAQILISTQHSAQLWQQWHPQAQIWEVPSRQDSVAQAQRMIVAAWDLGQWEREQTHESLLPYLAEEAAEYQQAIAERQSDAEICAELGDLLLQVLFHAEIARRRGAFSFNDVAQSFVSKMARRAPYLVDGTTTPVDIETQEALWQQAKQKEREH